MNLKTFIVMLGFDNIRRLAYCETFGRFTCRLIRSSTHQKVALSLHAQYEDDGGSNER